WVNVPAAKPPSIGPATIPPSGANSAVRSLPASFIFNMPFTVRISVQPEVGIAVWAVEDQLPAGWSAAKVSDGGAFDSRHGAVKFGPFFENSPRELTYEVTPTTAVYGAVGFAGVVS